MSHYKVVEAILNAGSPLTKTELQRELGLHPSTITAHIKLCQQKGYIVRSELGYDVIDDFDESDLDKIRPLTIDELAGDTDE